MSSVIVLDSSDEEEVPAKKPFIAPSIPATITPIKTTTSTKGPTTATQLKHKKTKPRPIPSGITITRRSPVNVAAAANNSANTSAATTNATPATFNDSFVAATISAATLAATSILNTTLPNKSGITAVGNILKTNATVKERQTPTPPRQMSQQQQQNQKNQQQMQAMQSATKQQQQAQQVLPHLSQMPQLQPSPLVLSKRLTATSTAVTSMQQQPPTNQQQKIKSQQNLPKLQQQKQNMRKQNTSPATLTPTMLPMIASVQSMAASATPPLQLLATPPHSAPSTFSDHQLFSPKSIHTTCSLPQSTNVTATRPQMSSSGSNNNTSNSSNKNINNSFKIMLPPKSSNNAMPTPTPVALQQINSGPRIAYVNSLAPQFQPATNNNKTANSYSTSKGKTSSATALPIPIAITTAIETITSDTPSMGSQAPTSGSGLSSVRRVKPTTLLRKNDEAWLHRTSSNATAVAAAAAKSGPKNFFDDDMGLEILPHSSSSTTNKTAAEKIAAAEFVKYMASRMPMLDAVDDSGVMIIPNTLTTTSTKNSYSNSTPKSQTRKSSYPLKIDLTDSPEKTFNARKASTPSTTPPPTSAAVGKSKSTERITNGDAKTKTSTEFKPPSPPLPLSSDYEELLKVCRKADPSADMEKLVKSKLPKYYYNVHPDFVRSKGFSKSLRTVITNIQKEPDLVYLHLKTIVDELKVRSKSKESPPTAIKIKSEEQMDDVAIVERVGGGNDAASVSGNAGSGGSGAAGDTAVDDAVSTGNKHTDEQIKKLNKALYILTKRIEVLESAEVDWEDEDSSYLQVERFKKRACQIYEKICDLTGESKNAHRLVKKPIQFNGTTYKQFNKTLQAYVNRTKEFPDYYDVLRMLEHCNRQYDYSLANFEMKRIAHDAFIKIGKLLQSRRKTDLYETVTHFTAHEKDPATMDPALQAKLSENQKKNTRISDVIEKYAREQDMIREELKEARQAKVAKELKSDSSDDDDDEDDVAKDDDVASTSASAAKVAVKQENKNHKKEDGKKTGKESNAVIAVAGGDDDDDDDDDDEEDDDEDEDEVNGSDLEADVEKLANGYLSDVESDSEIVIKETDCEEQEDGNKPKNKHDSLSVVVHDTTEIAATNKLQLDATQKIQNVSTKPQTTTTTQEEQSSNMSTNNSSESRLKTADPLTDGSQIATTAAIANGCVKSVTPDDSNKQSTTTQSPTIEIVSVASLKNNTNDGNNEALMDDEQQQQSKQPTTTNTTTKDSKRQRTVAEIVISDEES